MTILRNSLMPGKKGSLTYNDMNHLIPHVVHSPEDLDDLVNTLGTRGIDVLEDRPQLSSSPFGQKIAKKEEDVELDLTSEVLEATNDPVRIYLREMGTVPLLTRDGEMEIAKRIERGELHTLKALSRSLSVVRQIVAMGEDLKRGIRSSKEIAIFNEEEITEEILQNRLQDMTRCIDKLRKHYKRASQLAGRLSTIPKEKNAREYRRCRRGLAREIVRISLIIRNLGFSNFERKRLIDRVNTT
ncbi:MAG TPA: sigma-70 factor domain-containing protein, partial [Terriglobales bacterium]|nr:sigma-70 factor domain-containing protein [Terriglobales bacterium]